jgi:hypothetical protein
MRPTAGNVRRHERLVPTTNSPEQPPPWLQREFSQQPSILRRNPLLIRPKKMLEDIQLADHDVGIMDREAELRF